MHCFSPTPQERNVSYHKVTATAFSSYNSNIHDNHADACFSTKQGRDIEKMPLNEMR
jgi:hypothetical protein